VGCDDSAEVAVSDDGSGGGAQGPVWLVPVVVVAGGHEPMVTTPE
jgi:hypothetical protein